MPVEPPAVPPPLRLLERPAFFRPRAQPTQPQVAPLPRWWRRWLSLAGPHRG